MTLPNDIARCAVAADCLNGGECARNPKISPVRPPALEVPWFMPEKANRSRENCELFMEVASA